MAVLAGVFVGGGSSRMGGGAKGLLPAPSGEKTLVERWENVLAGLGARAVLVGDRGAYAGRSSLARVNGSSWPIGL